MTSLAHEVYQDLQVAGHVLGLQQFATSDLMHADDTLLVAGNARLVNALLSTIECESE